MESPKTPRLRSGQPSESADTRSQTSEHWVEQLSLLTHRLTHASTTAAEEDAVSRIWLLLNAKLRQLLLGLCRTHGWVQPEDLEEIISEKALDLIRSLDTGRWKPAESNVGEAVNYVVAVARNGLIDHLRKRQRDAQHVNHHKTPEQMNRLVDPNPSPDGAAASRELVGALADCVEELSERPRQVWICRTFYDLSSHDIARQPGVSTTVGNVDVIVGRARKVVRKCLERKGLTLGMAPAGCYAEIWKRFIASSVVNGPLTHE